MGTDLFPAFNYKPVCGNKKSQPADQARGQPQYFRVEFENASKQFFLIWCERIVHERIEPG